VRDRLSWMRFCGLGSGDAVPDAHTLWDFREALIKAKALDRLFDRLDRAIQAAASARSLLPANVWKPERPHRDEWPI